MSILERTRPHFWSLAALTLAGLVVFTLAALPIQQPGTMDSHYYYGGGRNLLESGRLEEPYLWNYLNDPAGLPAPSHLYWMPLPSLLAALGQKILGSSFTAAQIPYILLASGLPALSYSASWLLSRNRRHALTSGALTILCGFYFPFLVIPESFTPFAWCGGGALLSLGLWLEKHDRRLLFLAGLAAGLGHLCRADGLLLLGIALLLVLVAHFHRSTSSSLWKDLGIPLMGYLLATIPWFLRNWHQTGDWMPTAGAQTIFLRTYDELFSYGTPLSLERYWQWGWNNILQSKLAAGWSNLQTFVAVNNLIFLTPLTLIGTWRLRKRMLIWPAVGYSIALYGIMTLVFTFPGVRGGVFHSSIASLPIVFALAMVGLDTAIEWVAQRRRRWRPRSAKLVFSWGMILLAAGLSLLIYSRQVVGRGTWANPTWNQLDAEFDEVGDWLKQQTHSEPTVMVGNPPAFYYHSKLPAVVIPNEPVERVLAAAERYHASYLILDQNYPQPLKSLYQGEQYPGLELIWNQAMGAPPGIVVYRVATKQD